jgi:hypothetical protein
VVDNSGLYDGDEYIPKVRVKLFSRQGLIVLKFSQNMIFNMIEKGRRLEGE